MKRISIWLGSVLMGLSLAGSVMAQVTTNRVSFTTFEPEQGLRYSYPYYYNWGFEWPGCTDYFYSTAEPPDYTNNAGVFFFDNFPLAPFFATNNPAAGYGFGFGGGLNWDLDTSKLVGTNRDLYIVEFDCRVEGLVEGGTSGNGEFQVKFEAPDGTTGPTDGSADTLVQFNYGYSASSNWTHYVFSFEDASFGGGDWETFLQYKSLANNINFGCNWHQPDPQFGFDGDNQIWVDNIAIYAIDRPPVPPPPQVAFTVLEWNMDDKPVWYAWAAGTNGGWSENSYKGTFLADQAIAGAGVGGSNAFMFWMMNDVFATLDPASMPSWAGGNAGMGGPADFTQVASPDLMDYRLSMDVRAEGLAPGKTTTSFDVQTRFNTSTGLLVRVDTTFPNVSSNWTRVSTLLGKGGIGEGSRQNFTNGYMVVSEIPLQVQLNNITQSNIWQFDTDNKIYIDNVKVEHLVVATPALTIVPTGTNTLLVLWGPPSSGTAQLQTTVSPWVSASWANVPSATNSPVVVPVDGALKYFRTKWIPPF